MKQQFRLNTREVRTALVWLSVQACHPRDGFILSYAARLLMTDAPNYTHDLILTAIECGYRTRQEIMTVTGKSDKQVRVSLSQLQQAGRVVVRRYEADDRQTKTYWLASLDEARGTGAKAPPL